MDENTENIEHKEEQKEESKSTNRMFTQAENDKFVGEAIKRERAKYADYEETKTQLETLLAQQKEKDLAEKSELEKLQTINSEMVTDLTNAKTELSTLKKQQLRSDVLNGADFASLPRAYKNMVELSDNVEDIQASAAAVLEEFQKDTGKKVSATFGIPEKKAETISEPAKEIGSPEALANSLRSKLSDIINKRNAG
jgi:hypothetical protein